MDFYSIMGWIIFVIVAIFVVVIGRIYQHIRSDAGYNIGRNHMHDLGFTDEDMAAGKDDDDEDMYVFRKSNRDIRKDSKK